MSLKQAGLTQFSSVHPHSYLGYSISGFLAVQV